MRRPGEREGGRGKGRDRGREGEREKGGGKGGEKRERKERWSNCEDKFILVKTLILVSLPNHLTFLACDLGTKHVTNYMFSSLAISSDMDKLQLSIHARLCRVICDCW